MGKNFVTLHDYQNCVFNTDLGKVRDFGGMHFLVLGLVGEVGTLHSTVKKQQRDSESYINFKENLIEDLGDILWYLTAIARRACISIDDIGSAIIQGHDNYAVHSPSAYPTKSGLAFINFHRQISLLSPSIKPELTTTLLCLAGAVGSLAHNYRRRWLESDRAALAKHLINILRILIQAAEDARTTLDHVAEQNIKKISDRWPVKRTKVELLDNDYPEYEQLPRKLAIEIFQKETTGKQYVMQRCNGIYIGDRLTDNRMTDDDYRFHDVFHYAYAAVLGWSPVTRALFCLKRKSNARIDEGEDGARAAIIEEAVSTLIFRHAEQVKWFEGLKSGELSFDLLKNVRDLVAGYEVRCRPLWLWEEAILQGYAAFRFLKKHRRAKIRIDMHENKLTFECLAICK